MTDSKVESIEIQDSQFERTKEHIANLKHQAIVYHDRIVEDTGGTLGLRDEGSLESAVAAPFASYGGEMLHGTVFAKAGVLMRSLVQNHSFVDANKRTGFGMTEWFLFEYGYGLRDTISDDEIFNFVIGIAEGEKNVEQISDWLEASSDRSSARNFVKLIEQLASH